MRSNILHIIVALLLLPAFDIFGQWTDTTSVKPNIIDPNDSSKISNTTAPSNLQNNRTSSFYDSLASKAEKKTWSRELHRLIVRSGSTEEEKPSSDSKREDYFTRYTEKTIRNISINQLDVFGPTIFDTAQTTDNWIGKTGNALHISTNKRFISNYLLFSSGEKVDPYLLADNERILRSIPSLQDVRIYIIESDSTDYVDIQVVTKDVLSFGLAWEIFDIGYGEASVWNSNLLGLGHSLQYTAFYNTNKDPVYGYKIGYKVYNISNSLVNADLSHTKRYDLEQSTIGFSRDFITPSMILGGGIKYEKVNKVFTLETIDTTVPNVVSDYELYDGWGGFNLPFGKNRLSDTRRNYFITARVQSYNFFTRPPVTQTQLYEFYSRQTYLGSIGFTWLGFHTTRYVYGFGKTEDLPFGAMIKLTGGYEYNEFARRSYLGSEYSYARCTKNAGYFSGKLEMGGFYNNKIEQGAIKANFLHITPLLGNKRHNFRNFLNIDFVQGINRFDDEFSFIEDLDGGIRGVNNQLFRGDKNLFLNNEFVYYSPHDLLGFNFIYYFFTDAGLVNITNSTLTDNPLYMSMGIGVRIRNERLVFNTVQIQLNFFPIAPGLASNEKQYYNITSFPEYRMPDFANRIPEIIEF